jgi:hypothetical protein
LIRISPPKNTRDLGVERLSLKSGFMWPPKVMATVYVIPP